MAAVERPEAVSRLDGARGLRSANCIDALLTRDAQTVEVDVLDDHHLVVLFGEQGLVEHVVDILALPGGQVPVGLGHSRRRPLESLARGILADFLQQVTDQPFERRVPFIGGFHHCPLTSSPRYSNTLLAVSITATRRSRPGGRTGSSHCQKVRARLSPVVITPESPGTVAERS